MNFYKTDSNNPTLCEILSVDFGDSATIYVYADEVGFENDDEALFSVDSPCYVANKFLNKEYLNAKVVAIAGKAPAVRVLVDTSFAQF